MWPSDEELMLSYRNGDEDAFDMLYRRYEKPLLNFIYRMVMNAADAESLCQDVFLRVVRVKRKYRATAQFKAWLFRIALNLCRDRVRRMKHRSHLSQDDEDAELQDLIPDPSSDPVKYVETDELQALIRGAIALLPEDQHLVVILKEYQGLKFSEIADIMNCPIGDDILYYEFIDNRPEFARPGIILRGPASQQKITSPEAPAISNGRNLTLSQARNTVSFHPVAPPGLHPGYILDKIRKIENRNSLHLLYTNGINSLSLFEQPLEGEHGLGAHDFREYAVYQSMGQAGGTILAWTDGALSYVLIGNTEMSRLMEMAQSISAGNRRE
jgi:RNA polymerase sigma-70 factor (ECF subfamily)